MYCTNNNKISEKYVSNLGKKWIPFFFCFKYQTYLNDTLKTTKQKLFLVITT